jgi:hypothetical protein
MGTCQVSACSVMSCMGCCQGGQCQACTQPFACGVAGIACTNCGPGGQCFGGTCAMPGQDGGGSHGAQWHKGKLWIAALRPKLLLRVDPKTWVPEVAISTYTSPEKPRTHDMTIDNNGDIWLVLGNDSRNYKEGKPGLVKYDGKTGQIIGTYDFLPGSCDPHGLEFHNGTLISCDAGIHPGWPNGDSPHAGWVFKIEPA